MGNCLPKEGASGETRTPLSSDASVDAGGSGGDPVFMEAQEQKDLAAAGQKLAAVGSFSGNNKNGWLVPRAKIPVAFTNPMMTGSDEDDGDNEVIQESLQR
jgi:hypothetical protein